MKAVFLSDAHIRDHADENLPPLLAFLESLRGEIDRLYILGDLFDTWFGFRRVVFDEYTALLGALDALHRSGARIVYVTGNHDFEMGHFFTHILEADVHDTEASIEEDGLRAYLAHGDTVRPAGAGQRIVRAVLQCGLTRWLGRNFPPGIVWRVARWVRGSCHRKSNGLPEGMAEAMSALADAKIAAGFGAVVLAHTHVPLFEERESGGARGTYVNIGEWLDRRTFLRWEDGRLTLKQWRWPECAESDYAAGAPLS